jgi:hypothetical protein
MGAIVRGCVVLAMIGDLATAAEPKTERKTASKQYTSGEFKPGTEVDISGPYHAYLDGQTYPATVDIWGPDATVKISIDGQDKPMVGKFLKDQLQVMFKYGAANFNLTTLVQAQYDGCNFNGEYRRIDEKLGPKISPIVLTPEWFGTGGGGTVTMPLPRRMADVPGRYGMTLSKDGRKISADATFDVQDDTVRMSAGGRLYVCDFSSKEMAPLFWEGKRMDTFKLTPTADGFKGKLLKEVDGKAEEFEVQMGKGTGGGGGHERDWTYVYDAIFGGVPPVWIAKLTVHEQQAKLAIKIKGEKADLIGSYAEGILSGTGRYKSEDVSIRAEKVARGFAGVFRIGRGSAVRESSVVLRDRPARTAAASSW